MTKSGRYQLCCMHAREIPKEPGVYSIVSRNRKERYVGSTKDLNKRFRDHLFRLMKGNHPNPKLQRVFNKRQILFFKYVGCSIYDLRRNEQYVLTYEKANPDNLNRTYTAAHHAHR